MTDKTIGPAKVEPQSSLTRRLMVFKAGLYAARRIVEKRAAQFPGLPDCQDVQIALPALDMALRMPQQSMKVLEGREPVGAQVFLVSVWNETHSWNLVAESDGAAWQIVSAFAKENWSKVFPDLLAPQAPDALITRFFGEHNGEFDYKIEETNIIKERSKFICKPLF